MLSVVKYSAFRVGQNLRSMEITLQDIEPTPLIQIMSFMKRNHPTLEFKGAQKLLKHDDGLEFHLTYND